MDFKKNQGLLYFLLAQLILLLAFYFQWLNNSSTYFFRDLTHYIEPFARFTGESMRRGQIPLWNPWCYCGMPQVAISVQGICYPPTWLFAVMPFSMGLAATMLVHQLICGLGGFLLISSFGWGLLPAIICGATLAMSGYEFCFTSIFSLVESSAWCPLALWSVRQIGAAELDTTNKESDKAADSRQSITNSKLGLWTALTAFIVAMHVYAGHPELCSVEFGLLAAFISWSAYCAWKEKQNNWLQIALFRIRAIGLGVVLAMPVVLPAYEWFGLSRRSEGLNAKEALLLSANWYDILGLVLPQPLGDMQQRWSEFRPVVMPGQMLPYMASAFVGSVVFTLAIWSLADKTWKERWLVLGLLIVVALLALGENTPFMPIILSVTKSAIRFPVKLMFFVIWGLSVMAARGLYVFTVPDLQRSCRGYIYSFVFWGLFALAAILLLQNVHILDPLLSYDAQSESMKALIRRAEPLLAVSGLIASALGGLSSALGLVQDKTRGRFAFLAYLLIAMSALVLLQFAISNCRLPGPANYFKTDSAVENLLLKLKASDPPASANRILGLYIEHFTVPPAVLSRDTLSATIATYQYSRQALRTNTNIDFSEPSSFGFEGSCTGEYYFFFHQCFLKSSQAYGIDINKADDDALARFCQCTATRYAISQTYRFADNPNTMVPVPLLDKRFFQAVAENRDLNLRVYRVLDTLPRAYLAGNWEFLGDHSDALDRVFDPRKRGFDPAKKTLLELSPNAPRPQAQSGTKSSIGKLSLLRDNLNELYFEVDAKQSAYLVLADQYYPGWLAELDGKAVEIARANCFTRAVYVPAGVHKVSFFYRPPSFYGGLFLAALGLFWILYIIWFSARRQKKQEKLI